MSEVKIADFSHWNAGLKYSLLPSLGVYGAILRVTEQNNQKDRSFDAHVAGLKANNIPIFSYYKYSYGLNMDAIRNEANQVVNVLKQYPESTGKIVWFDLEDSSQLRLGRATLMKFAAEFKSIIEKAGYRFGIYCSSGVLDSIIDTNAVNYDLWLAAYSYSDDGSIPERLRPNRGQKGWQFSSKFKIGGQNCDMSVFDKDYIDKIISGEKIQKAIESEKTEILDKDTESIDNIIENATRFIIGIAQDDSHGYDQIYRWNERGDYDCSSLVITSWQQAGVPVKTKGATYTGNMYDVFLKCGFKDVTSSVNLSNGAGMKRGDVLLNHVHHVAMFIGNGQECEASINERGGATGGTPGDQTGQEIKIRSYRNYPWNVVLRYCGGATVDPSSVVLSKGSVGNTVKTMQTMLISCGYSCGSYGADGDFGSATETALKNFQRDHGLDVDGQYGPMSKAALEKAYNNTKVISSLPRTMTVIKTPGVVRKSAKKASKCLTKLAAGTKVEAISKKTNDENQVWVRIKYQDITGWIISDNLKG